MPPTPSPDDEPNLDPANNAGEDESSQAPEDVSDAGVINEFDTPEQQEAAMEADLAAIESVITHEDDQRLAASGIVPVERGYTIEQLKAKDEAAWNKVCARYLKLAVYRYKSLVIFYLPGVDVDDAKSAVGSILSDLFVTIQDYQSLPQMDKAFKKALFRDICSLQRKFLTQKRGEGRVDVTSEVHGLEQADTPLDQFAYQNEDDSKNSGLEGKINAEYADWSAFQTASVSETVNRTEQMRLIQEAMKQLKPAEAQLINLSFILNLKQREVAERMGRNPKQIGSGIMRAVAKLRKLVRQKMIQEKKNLL